METFESARRILTARADDRGKRASNGSDYLFTGRVRCPECGGAMIGTRAHGKAKVYRYYTCFARARYGNSRCLASRMNADAFDAALLAAMRDFYAERTDLIEDAVSAARAAHGGAHAARSAERASVAAELTKTSSALDRYFAAFEDGTMDATACSARITSLDEKVRQLRQRRDELDEEIDAEPTMPDAATLTDVVTHIDAVVAAGSPEQTKALVGTLVAEVRVTGPGEVVPVFRAPQGPSGGATDEEGPAPRAGTGPRQHGVRALPRSVEVTSQHTNTWLPVFGATVAVSSLRSRATRSGVAVGRT